MEFILSSEKKCGIFLLIITGCGWGESGKVILQVSIAVFFHGAVEKFFGQRWLSPLEKIGPYAYAPI